MSTPEGPAEVVGGIVHVAGAPALARPSAGKIGMWMFLATDAMGFAALLMAYAILRVGASEWPDALERLDVLQAAHMTALLVTSSFTITLAVGAARAGRETARLVWLSTTIVLGLAFLGGQALEYQHLLEGARPMGLTTDQFAGTFYAVTGYHGLHVCAGLVILVALLLASRPRARSLEVAAIFWHFVDLAWIPIFSFLYLLPDHMSADASPPSTLRLGFALVVLLALTALEVTVVGLPVDRARRITALVGLGMTKGLVVLTAFMRIGRESRILRAGVLVPLVLAPGFAIALMLDAAFPGVAMRRGSSMMAALAVAGVAALAPLSAWALCPNCLGQNETLTPTLKLVGLFLLVPPTVAFFVARAIRRLPR